MGKMRATTHNGRWGRGGAYSTKHNDRQFDTEKEPHINNDKIRENVYWDCYNGFKNEKCNTENQFMTFDAVEKKFYEENFNQFLTDRNQKYINRRQYKNVWTADDYRKRKNSCPEETIFQIGRQGETVDAETLKKVFLKFREWHENNFPQVKILNFALHSDEATPHIQMRRVWVAEDENGKKFVSQNKVLAGLKIEKPNAEKETHRYNNPKQTFTAICRKKFVEICENYGLEIEKDPKEKSKVGLSLIEYQRQQEELKLKKLQIENAKLKQSCVMMKVMCKDFAKEVSQKNSELEGKKVELQSTKNEIQKEKNVLKNIKNNVEIERENLKFLSNLVKICDNNEKKLKIITDVVKANDKTGVKQPKYDDDGNPMFDSKGKALTEFVGSVFGKLTPDKLASLTIPPERKQDFDDWNLKSEAEKADILAHQKMDNY